MRGQSHRALGRYLARHYLNGADRSCVAAFSIGCIQPDRNLVTYLKGSFRHQWLRGHNYRNARRFMKRISRRLERRNRLSLYDYYTLGKLIHYTADAFTYAHNDCFPTQLSDHMEYEARLQDHFLSFLAEDPQVDTSMAGDIMNAISAFHREYEQTEYSIHNDARFALTACCCVLALLFAKPFV